MSEKIWNPVGWVGLFFLLISGFLPHLKIDMGAAKISFVSPLTLLINSIEMFVKSVGPVSILLLAVALVTVICYIAGLGWGISGLVKWEAKSIYYGGIIGLIYAFMSFISAYFWFKIMSWPEPVQSFLMPMIGAEWGFISAIIGSLVLMFSGSLGSRSS
ncbi:hypothetical protein [Archaeoglobus sp.]|jgi:hypothetical protein|uniref:hypothetical protein n=1 Tax=Archaeoglobus sp. TaxID=1872626 RepID=UPI0024AC5CE9|nr:hypothetical protein [Archaeoglobus sp.]MDI3497893.1 hypothetical protein [Archaeoglobus sp.]